MNAPDEDLRVTLDLQQLSMLTRGSVLWCYPSRPSPFGDRLALPAPGRAPYLAYLEGLIREGVIGGAMVSVRRMDDDERLLLAWPAWQVDLVLDPFPAGPLATAQRDLAEAARPIRSAAVVGLTRAVRGLSRLFGGRRP